VVGEDGPGQIFFDLIKRAWKLQSEENSGNAAELQYLVSKLRIPY